MSARLLPNLDKGSLQSRKQMFLCISGRIEKLKIPTFFTTLTASLSGMVVTAPLGVYRKLLRYKVANFIFIRFYVFFFSTLFFYCLLNPAKLAVNNFVWVCVTCYVLHCWILIEKNTYHRKTHISNLKMNTQLSEHGKSIFFRFTAPLNIIR